MLSGVALVAATAAVAGVAAGPQTVAMTTFRAYLAAWNRADAHAIAAQFAPDGDFINPTGYYARGPAEVEAFYKSAFSRGYAGSVGGFTPKAIRSITRDAIAADGVWSIKGARGPDGKVQAPEGGLATAVLVRGRQGWRVALLREQSSAQALEIPAAR